VSATAVASFENVTKVYTDRFPRRRSVQAVAGVTLAVNAGDVFGLLGPNRAGKTTLVKLLLSLCRPTSGAVLRLGRPVADRSTLARVGYLHENQHFPRYWSARGLLAYYGALALVPPEAVRQRVPELLDMVGLADRSREPIGRFSKGMIQRLGLAQALLCDPDLLVLDEPTEGLDLDGRLLLKRVIRSRQEKCRTVLLISHVLTEVEEVCNRVAVLRGGQVVFQGPTADLTRDPKTRAPRPLEAALAQLYHESKA
jgi:ABC-2 type transport system ATP-binding protein